MVVLDGGVLFGFVHARRQQLLPPLVLLDGGPLLDEGFRLGTDLELKSLIKHANVLEQAPESQNFLTCLQVEVAEGQELATLVVGPLEVLHLAEFAQQPHHAFVRALRRYIFYKHFLPDFLLWFGCIGGSCTCHSEGVDGEGAAADHGGHGDGVQH